MTTTHPLLCVSGLAFVRNGIELFHGVNFHINSGTVTCLIGGNGAGKTTLLNVICGYLRPSVGAISFAGVSILDKDAGSIARMGLGRSFQEVRMASSLSVRDNMLLAVSDPSIGILQSLLKRSSYRDPQLVDRVTEYLELFQLTSVQLSYPGTISYGQQKLLSLACCAVRCPRLILLDEPSAGINVAYQEILLRHIRRFADEGAAVLVVDHQVDFIGNLGDEYLVLENGCVEIYKSYSDIRGHL
jgi:ABC-type branched-subunit amino acid transport system ATPase component